MLLAAFGVFLVFLPRRLPHTQEAPAQASSRRTLLTAGLGLAMAAVTVVMLLGLTDGFHRIDEAGHGRWALRHAARGNVATFSGKDLLWIDAAERRRPRSGRKYSVRVALTDGRSFSVTTGSAAALEELRKFATTANLPKGKVIISRGTDRWINGATGFTLKDCVGVYGLAGESGPSRHTFEFWLDGERLAGKETVANAEGARTRVLRNVKVSDSGGVEFEPAAFTENSDKGTVSISFGWSSDGGTVVGRNEAGRFVGNGLEIGAQKYTKR